LVMWVSWRTGATSGSTMVEAGLFYGRLALTPALSQRERE
jgi:hypothetical protein